MSGKLLRENLGELRLRYFAVRRECDDLMAANVLVNQENVRLRAALEKIAGVGEPDGSWLKKDYYTALIIAIDVLGETK